MGPTVDTPPDLTDEQRDLLRAAVREGYFKIPRETSLSVLAARHGISDVRASELLRSGIDVHLRHCLFED